MATFEQIQAELQAMLNIEGELTEEQEQARKAYIEELCQLESAKIDSAVYFMREADAKATFFEGEAKYYAAKAKAIRNRIEGLKMQYKFVLQEAKKDKAEGERYKVWLKYTPAIHISVPAETLPEKYQRVKTEIEADKNLLKAALQNGEEIKGVTLVDNVSLQIK